MTHILTHLLDALSGKERITVQETERLIVTVDGRLDAILGPGQHKVTRSGSVRELHRLDQAQFGSKLSDALFRSRPDLAEPHLSVFRTEQDEVMLITRDGRPFQMLFPEQRAVFWKDAGPFDAQRFALTPPMAVDDALARRLEQSRLGSALSRVDVADGHVGMLFLDNVFSGRLDPGAHAFWAAGPRILVRHVDLRSRVHEVAGQEILTKDRVTVRVNLSANFRVTDPERAVTMVQDFEETMHRALQLALRRRLGALTLDALLSEKGVVDAAETVRAEMAAIGVELGEVALKDVILPGEMREILNRVVEAEKEAEANVIRRREETNATRSLLNTAKVMAENPVMLRLKELEALETIAGKVESLTVHNGTKGLLGDIVNLRDG